MEVEREVVGAGNKYITVAKADAERSDIRAVLEDSEGHNRIAGKLPLVEYEEAGNEDTKDDEADYFD